MDQFTQWNTQTSNGRIPLPHEDFDDYFGDRYNDIDNLFNETLTGIQDLDVPSGFVTNDERQYKEEQKNGHQTKHSRKISGTAIFGFADHTKQLSLSGVTDLYKSVKPSVDLGKSISPGELLKSISQQTQQPSNAQLDFNFANEEVAPQIFFDEQDEFEDEPLKQIDLKKEKEYIVTNENPKSYRFPPSPSPEKFFNRNTNFVNDKEPQVNNFSVKYLQDLRFQPNNSTQYVDDIAPLLEVEDNSTKIQMTNLTSPLRNGGQQLNSYNQKQIPKFVPIPVQNPVEFKKLNNPPFNQNTLNLKEKYDNIILPPPSPPTLSNGSPEWQSSPEPPSPSPGRATLNKLNPSHFSSPLHPQLKSNANFYVNQYFSEGDYGSAANITSQPSNYEFNGQSSPFIDSQAINSSPIRYDASPTRNINMTYDDTVDANATITQITPLKNQLPITPARNNIKLEWSPIISPNAKASRDVKKHIQQSSPRRKVKKTSLLPPGELDQYWEGPDEDKVFTCTYKGCGKKFTRRYNVRSHIQTHLSDRPFACSYCPKKFVRQHDLNRHVKGHLEARYCKCPCGKEFARLDAMKKHRERNICIGGVSSTTNNCITKPPRRSKNSIIDEITSDKINEELSSSNQEPLLSTD